MVPSYHPNGRPITDNLKRPERYDATLFQDVFPDTDNGKLLKGILVAFLIKQEPRLGWARKSACDEFELLSHPCETVAAHQWGVSFLITTITVQPQFQEELPEFDILKAIQMAIVHDNAELITGDITPVDGITPEQKHQMESRAMKLILGCHPEASNKFLADIYARYERRECNESKFVKDCDKLDFMFTAFLLERQGFSGFSEFYENSMKEGLSTKMAGDLVSILVKAREKLIEQDLLVYKTSNQRA